MNKKAFTLIELLAVIAILAILGTLTVVIVEGTLKKSNKNVNEIERKNIKEAAKAYVSDNLSIINDELDGANGCYTINVKNDLGDGYIEVDNNKTYDDLIVTKHTENIVVEYPDEITINTTCNGTTAPDGYYELENGENGITITGGTTITGTYSGDATKVIIPNGITEIGSEVFFNKGLENIILPYSLTTIGDSAFASNLFKEIIFPNNVEEVGSDLVVDSPLLEKLIIPKKMTEYLQNQYENPDPIKYPYGFIFPLLSGNDNATSIILTGADMNKLPCISGDVTVICKP